MALAFMMFLWATFVALVPRDSVRNPWPARLFATLLTATVAWHVAHLTMAADRAVYVWAFRRLSRFESPWDLKYFDEPAFQLFLWGMARIIPQNDLFLYGLVGLLAAVAQYASSRILLPSWASYLVLLTAVSSGLLLAYASVAIRQGLAINLLLLGVALYAKKGRNTTSIALFALAAMMHWSAIAAVAAAASVLILSPRFRVVVGAWVVSALTFVSGINERFLGGITPQFDRYTSSSAYEAYGVAGARVDFLAFSAVILIGSYFLGRRLSEPWSSKYERLLVMYLALNSTFLIFGFVAYSDRIAAYSWSLAPLLAWYPIARSESGRLEKLAGLGIVTACLGIAVMTGSIRAMTI